MRTSFVPLFRIPASGLLISVFCGLLPFLAACVRPPAYGPPERIGTLPSLIEESSGLAASRRDPRLLWTHNDSANQPILYAFEPDGTLRGTVLLSGVRNIDWEEIVSFKIDGRAWLLIADVGDNTGRRKDCALHIIAEPDPATLSPDKELAVRVSHTIPVRYPDGPRDCEAVAVDARAGVIYLLAKRTSPHGLYTLPLRPPANGVVPVATRVAEIPNSFIPQPTASQRLLPIPTGRYRAQPTSMDIAADGSAAVVLSYGDVLIFPRQKKEPWQSVFVREPVVLEPHGLLQAEGVAFGADNRTIYVTSEGKGSGIIRYPVTR